MLFLYFSKSCDTEQVRSFFLGHRRPPTSFSALKDNSLSGVFPPVTVALALLKPRYGCLTPRLHTHHGTLDSIARRPSVPGKREVDSYQPPSTARSRGLTACAVCLAPSARLVKDRLFGAHTDGDVGRACTMRAGIGLTGAQCLYSASLTKVPKR